MTRYPADHKEQTRSRLIDVARAAFREGGFEAVSIDRLMKAAGLTRGGFYAHFDSKEALVEEVLRIEPGLLRDLKEVPSGRPGRKQAATLFAAYLDPNQRDDLIYCPLVAHPMDALRGGEERQTIYAEQITAMLDRVEALMEGDKDAERRAVLVTVLSVGAAILSSAMTDPKIADHIEGICSSEIRRQLKVR